ncbi:MAG: response regulator [Pseudomonadota bacterium]
MSLVEQIETELPYMRRYARAVTGDAALGDRQVERVLTDLLENGPGQLIKRALFEHLEKKLAAMPDFNSPNTVLDDIMLADSETARRAFLLHSVEDFSKEEIANIMMIETDDVSILLEQAQKNLSSYLQSRILIIEDETLIAASLNQIASSLGHEVVGLAGTESEAIELARQTQPDLILADVKLADGSLGTDAVAEITRTLDVPVIFITAYPETFLTGKGNEPTWLITKPFKEAMVRAVISQVLYKRKAQKNKAGA